MSEAQSIEGKELSKSPTDLKSEHDNTLHSKEIDESVEEIQGTLNDLEEENVVLGMKLSKKITPIHENDQDLPCRENSQPQSPKVSAINIDYLDRTAQVTSLQQTDVKNKSVESTMIQEDEMDVIASMNEETIPRFKENREDLTTMLREEKSKDFVVQIFEEDGNGGKRINSPENLYDEYMRKICSTEQSKEMIPELNYHRSVTTIAGK